MGMQRIPGNVRRREAFPGPADLARFFRGDRLETMPRRAKDRAALLQYVASRFERDREYPEPEVNSELMAVADDVASLRRYLIDAGLLTRDRGVYRRR